MQWIELKEDETLQKKWLVNLKVAIETIQNETWRKKELIKNENSINELWHN